MNDLDGRLLAAHAKNDRAALVTLYTLAADQAPTEQAKRFYLTHAYVFALETDHPDSAVLRARL
ncbi:MAG: hypothetical protein ACI92Z_003209 [Paracoccaceae bacterium]|jgi:hypothetical protein